MKADITFLTNLNKPAGNTGLTPDAHYWRRRIASELLFAAKFSDELCACAYDESVRLAVEKLKELYRESGAVTKAHALEVEGMLGDVSAAAKEYTVICVSHAHIDMNWMWGWAETAAITLDTFRTVLALMNEYENFTFSQSQASVYAIAEKYDPALFDEIKKRVAEGRWEVTASTWVEPDKNMPSGESLTRHILYTKNYFRDKFGLAPEELEIDFEPDTFGHNIGIPEILAHGGVKYYYHCRGHLDNILYRYRAPSGAEVLCFRDPEWYNADITPDIGVDRVDYFRQTGTKTTLKVYGVGDHGGGPTRRDIERIIDMGSWPVAPAIKFGTYREFFKTVEPEKDSFPMVDRELNFIFDGCYTSQTRIKAANRIAENRLFQAELMNAGAAIGKSASNGQDYFEPGWVNTLFNHFHDILPGSGVVDTREAALGLFQDTLSRTNTSMSNAMRAISAAIDTTGLTEAGEASGGADETFSEGAGVGCGVTDFAVPAAERGKGLGRIYHVFNNSPLGGRRLVKFLLWDWPGVIDNIAMTDGGGAPVPFQVIDTHEREWVAGSLGKHYWGHSFCDMLAEVEIEPYGYATIVLQEKSPTEVPFHRTKDYRAIRNFPYRLENGRVAVDFNPLNMEITSFVDKRGGKKIIGGAGLRYVREDPMKAGSAWRTGRYMSCGPMEDIRVTKSNVNGDALRQWIRYECKCGSSKLDVTVSLDKDAAELCYEVVADWKEIGSASTFVPQLQFSAALGYEADEYLCDVPFGVVARPGLSHDVPCQSFICAKNPSCEGSGSAAIFAKTKYGFRGFENTLSVHLIHSTYDPDPYPEVGIHRIEFAVGAECSCGNLGLLRRSAAYNCPPVAISGTAHAGERARAGSLLRLEGDVILSAVKLPEDGDRDKVIVRCYEPDGKRQAVRLGFGRPIRAARLVDTLERPVDGDVRIDGDVAEFDVGAYKVCAVEVEF